MSRKTKRSLSLPVIIVLGLAEIEAPLVFRLQLSILKLILQDAGSTTSICWDISSRRNFSRQGVTIGFCTQSINTLEGHSQVGDEIPSLSKPLISPLGEGICYSFPKTRAPPGFCDGHHRHCATGHIINGI